MKKASAQRKPPTSEGNATLSEFAAALGSSKGLDPIPPDQYLSFRDKRYPPAQRLLGALLEHTIRWGSGNWSTFAVDAKGAAVFLPQLAAKVKMDPGNARRTWREMTREGRVRSDKAGRLYLCGDFVLPSDSPRVVSPEDEPKDEPEDNPKEDSNTGEQKAKKKVCTDLLGKLFKPYYIKQISKLPETAQEEILTSEVNRREKHNRVIADLIAAERVIADREQSTMLASYGVNVIKDKRKIDESKASEMKARQRRIDALVPAVEKYVQTFFEEVCTDTKNGSVQTSPPLVSPEVLLQRNTVEVSNSVESKKNGNKLASYHTHDSRKAPTKEILEHFSAISRDLRPKLGTPNDQTLANFWNLFQKVTPGWTVPDLGKSVAVLVKENAGLATWGGVFSEFRALCEKVAKATNGGSHAR